MRRLVPATAVTVVLALAVAGCTGSEPGAEPATLPSDASTSASEPTTPTQSDPEPSGTDDAWQWEPVPGSMSAEATVSGPWTLVRPIRGSGAALTGPARRSISFPSDYEVTAAMIDGGHAVVAAQHLLAEEPDIARIIDLDSLRARTLDGDSDVPTTTGGPWALGSGLLVHATTVGRDYCLAIVDLASGRSRRGPCVPPPQGINHVRISPAGISAMTIDGGRPSCRTLNRVEGGELVPLRGVPECRGWEAVTTETAAIWGVASGENRVEESDYFLDAGSGRTDLGRGTSGTLTWCGDAAYFARDPQRDSDPARLVRVEPDGTTEVVYESPGRGNAFLAAPRCGGTDLTISAFSDAGDEQVTASLG